VRAESGVEVQWDTEETATVKANAVTAIPLWFIQEKDRTGESPTREKTPTLQNPKSRAPYNGRELSE
jgi:hypothetical protein